MRLRRKHIRRVRRKQGRIVRRKQRMTVRRREVESDAESLEELPFYFVE